MKKRAICLLMTAVLLCMCTMPAMAAKNYGDLVSDILDSMSTNNSRCSGAPQQAANGAYRLVEMLAVIAMEKDNGQHSDLISNVLDDMSTNNARCSGAPQQTANGTYRAVDMLAIIAMELDSKGTYRA